MKTQEKQLYYLHELSDYTIDDGYTDIRGWTVKDSALRNIGTVKNLLVNKVTKRVVYVDVEIDPTIINAGHDPYGDSANTEIREFINEKGENHVIIPIGLVNINMEPEYIFTESIDHQTFAETRRIRKNTPIDREYENAVLDSYGTKAVPPVKRDREIENARENRQDMVDANRDNQEERMSEKASTDNDPEEEWYNAEYESLTESEFPNDENFYGRREFDDSRFHRGKE